MAIPRELISHLKEHKQRVHALKLRQDDTIAISGSRDRCILTWDLRSEVSDLSFLVGCCLIRWSCQLFAIPQKRVMCHMQRMGGINDFVLSRCENFIISVGKHCYSFIMKDKGMVLICLTSMQVKIGRS